MTKGKVGVGKRVHWIVRTERLSTGELWAVSACGWCGLYESVVMEEVSCRECLK
jgi:hypothetical protein